MAHPRSMAPELTPPPPGSMTVPPLFGWQEIAVVLVLLGALGVAFLVLATARAGTGERSEWQAYLAGRSSSGREPVDHVRGAPAPGPAAGVDGSARTGPARTV
jgi:hypothetical protein